MDCIYKYRSYSKESFLKSLQCYSIAKYYFAFVFLLPLLSDYILLILNVQDEFCIIINTPNLDPSNRRNRTAVIFFAPYNSSF
jgi:hypothetical protein